MSHTAKPATLDRAGIAGLIPHQGTMCLLDRLLHWTPADILCSAVSHRDPHNPLRTASGLLAPCIVEYAAQAMALHGALVAPDEAGARPGYLASVRGVRLHVTRLDEVEGELRLHAERLAGDSSQILYTFRATDALSRPIAEGRATVVLNTPLPTETNLP